jgi:phospholipid/cholesterol/gamma-HCH transport system substrate-binding protein
VSPPVRRHARTRSARRRRLHPLAVAAITILATLFITYYAFNEGLPFVHHFSLDAVVNNSVAVRSSSPVRIAGVDVGRVTSVSPQGSASKINFTLQDNGQPVHTDATIRVRPRVFLEGGYYLDLDPGSPSAPILKDGGTIPEAQTQTPVQFYNVLSTFDYATRSSLQSLLGSLDAALGPNSFPAPGTPLANSGAAGLKATIPQLAPVFKDTALVTRGLHGTAPGDVENLLSSTAAVTTTLANSSSQLADLVTSLDKTSSALAASDGSLAQSISGLDQTLRVTPGALSAVDASLPPLVNLAQALAPSLKPAPKLLDDLTGAVTELASVVAPTERAKLLTTLKSTFQEFPALLTQLGSAFPIGKSVTDCLQSHLTPVLKSVVPDGALSSGRPEWQDFVHFLGGLVGASQNFDANGPWIRLLAGAGTNGISLGPQPTLGQVVGTAPPGGGAIEGARPAWVGDLPSTAYQPGVPCATQRVPSLASPTAASDARSLHAASPPALNPAALRSAVARAQKAVKAR